MNRTIHFLASTLLLSTMQNAVAVSELCNKQYMVTITNLTLDQGFSPAVLVTHRNSISLFNAGTKASNGIIAVAEAGQTSPLVTALSGKTGVCAVVAATDHIDPGKSATYTIKASSHSVLSAVGMLVNTNDAFYGLHNANLKATLHRVPAYDAGSEVNDEDCANVPGPACGGGGLDAAGGEGFVFIHNGIHGGKDLDPAKYDWRNPVASIRIKLKR